MIDLYDYDLGVCYACSMVEYQFQPKESIVKEKDDGEQNADGTSRSA